MAPNPTPDCKRRGSWLSTRRGSAAGISSSPKESSSFDTYPGTSQDEASVHSRSVLLDEMPTTAMPNIPEPTSRIVRRASVSNGGGQSVNLKPVEYPERKLPEVIPMIDDGYHHTEDFENMIIECNNSDSSFGDITYDESIVDEEYYRNRHAHQMNGRTSSGGRSSDKRSGHHKSRPCDRSPSKQKQTSRLVSKPKEDSRRNDVHNKREMNCIVPCPDDDDDIDEQEMALIELAMERSLRDCSFSGARDCSSVASSKFSKATYRSHTSTGSGVSSGSNMSGLAGSGCHLAMMGNRPRSNVTTENGARFLWKRDGKKWLKVPLGGSDDGNLHAIDEEKDHGIPYVGLDEKMLAKEAIQVERKMAQTMYDGDKVVTPTSNTSTLGYEMDAALLERMEQEMLEEALHRSMSCFHNSGSLSTVSNQRSERSPSFRSPDYKSPPPRTSSMSSASMMLPPFSPAQSPRFQGSQRRSSNGSPHVTDRCHDEDEREIMALERSIHDMSLQSFSSNASYESSRSSNSFANSVTHQPRPPRPSIARPSPRGDDRLAGAGCHLAMIAGAKKAKKPSTRAILNGIDFEEDEEELMAEHLQPVRSSHVSRKTSRRSSMRSDCSEHRVGDSAGRSSTGVKLVWKRGPNNKWGKFPETDEDEPCMVQADTDRSMKESAKRSVRER